MTPLGPTFLQRRKFHYAQHSPPWSTPLWLAALAACVLDHFFCLSINKQDVSHTSPSYVASVQRLLSLFVELCLMCSNTAVMFHIVSRGYRHLYITQNSPYNDTQVYRASRRKADTNWAAYLCPIVTFLLLVFINVALIAVPMIAPAALVTMTPIPGSMTNPSSYYHYSSSLLMLTYGVALSLVALAISAGTVLSWGFGQSLAPIDEEPLPREELLGLTWGQNGDARA
jgi:hypothetical protein